MNERYPRLEVNLEHLKHNVAKIVEKCGGYGIQVAGVIKGATGHAKGGRRSRKRNYRRLYGCSMARRI